MKAFFPDKLIIQASWLVKIRWYFSFFAFIVISTGCLFSFAELNYLDLYITIAFLFFLNILYFLDIKRIRKFSIDTSEIYVKRNIQIQIAFDFLILTFLLHFSGVIVNPCFIFFIFHLVIASIILPPKSAYFLTLLAVFLFSSLTISEYFGFINHYAINRSISSMISGEAVFFFTSLGVYVIASFIAIFFAVTLSGQLRLTKNLVILSNQSLLEKDKIKNEFIHKVTHDIKSSLATIQSCLSVVDKQILEPVTMQNADFVNKALNRTNTLTLFVNDLMSLSKMKLENRFETAIFSLSEVVNNVVSQIKPDAEKKNIEISLQISDNSLIMSGNMFFMEKAVFNIVQNAVKYTPAFGKISIVVKKSNEKIIIVISDNGYGIPENDIPYIFDEFFRGENVKSIEGNGLGLPLVKAVVGKHNGSINVKSKLNHGSTFTLLFNTKWT